MGISAKSAWYESKAFFSNPLIEMAVYEPLLIFYKSNRRPFDKQPRLTRQWIERMERQACDQGFTFYRPW